MANQKLKPVVAGTPSGYIIRWTCPECYTENIIINRTPGEFFKAARESTCKKCRKRSVVSTTRFNK